MKIKKKLLTSLIELSKGAYPREVGGILLNNPIDDFVLVPGKFDYNSVQVYTHNIPIYPNSMGTFHSHPSPNYNPSNADLRFFSKMGKTHLIIAAPYSIDSVRAYNSRGEQIEIELIE